MNCHECQTEITDGAKYCPQCGCLLDSTNVREACITDLTTCENFIREGKGSREYIRKNFHSRLSDWKQGAELGFWQAQWLLGRCYDECFGVELNKGKAIGWHLRAAEEGYAAAQNYIGSCYQDGDGFPQDEAEAVKWYRKAAEQGYAIAQCNLGWCYDVGSGVAVDEAEAVKWFLEAAEQGSYTAGFNLGVHYERGKGVAEDKREALKWYRKAADAGYERSRQAMQKLEDELAGENELSEKQVRQGEVEFRKACQEALADGKLTADEAGQLKNLAKSLEMPKEAMKQIFAEEKKIFHEKQKVQQGRKAEQRFRIACKNAVADGKVTVDEKRELGKLGKSLNMSKAIMDRLFKEEIEVFLKSQKARPAKDAELKFRNACKKVLADGKVTPLGKDALIKLAKSLKMPKEAVKRILEEETKILVENRREKQSS